MPTACTILSCIGYIRCNAHLSRICTLHMLFCPFVDCAGNYNSIVFVLTLVAPFFSIFLLIWEWQESNLHPFRIFFFCALPLSYTPDGYRNALPCGYDVSDMLSFFYILLIVLGSRILPIAQKRDPVSLHGLCHLLHACQNIHK